MPKLHICFLMCEPGLIHYFPLSTIIFAECHPCLILADSSHPPLLSGLQPTLREAHVRTDSPSQRTFLDADAGPDSPS